MSHARQRWPIRLVIGLAALLVVSHGSAWADTKANKVFKAVITDTQGVETEVKNVLFYWEEKVSEPAYVPHELRQIPVKRGSGTLNVKFDAIRQIDVAPAPDKSPPILTITLTNGKTGEFILATAGSFKGESDFGEINVPVNGLKKIIFK
jgi:hypothetical protein